MKQKFLLSKLFLLASCFAAVFPIVFVVSGSLLDDATIADRYGAAITAGNAGDFCAAGLHFVRLELLPAQPTLEQYRAALGDAMFFRRLINSVCLTAPVIAAQYFLAPMAAYGLEGIRWKYKEAIFFAYVILMLMPTQLTLVPNFIAAGWFGMRDSALAVILPAMFHPLGVFLIRQQLKNFPRSCIEAAELDGAGAYRAYRAVVRPNLTSVVSAMAVLLFADNWNLVDQAVIFLRRAEDQPLSTYLSNFSFSDAGPFFAVSVLYLIPPLLVFLFGQKRLAEGITLSAVKMN